MNCIKKLVTGLALALSFVLGFSIFRIDIKAADNIEPIVLDVDMCGDVDDIMAIRLAENYDIQNKVKLLAVTSNVMGNEDAIAGMLTKEGFGDVPVGVSPYPNDTSYPEYWDKFSETTATNEKIDAVKLLRRTLAESYVPVSIVTTGYLTNIYGLMLSEGDEYSPLSGMQLIREKVKELHVTGGVYPFGVDFNYAYVPFAPISARYVFENWDSSVPLFIYTYDLGGPLMCGGNLQNMAETDYLAWALKNRGVESGTPSWDAFTVFVFANFKDSEIHGITLEKCNMEIDQDGADVIEDRPDGKFYRIKKSKDNEYDRDLINEDLK